MKKHFLLNTLYLSCLVLLSLSFYAFVASEKEKPISSLANVNIQFGRGPNCTSRGLCSVDAPSGSLGFSGGNIVPAQISSNANNQTVITIYKQDISVSAMQTQFVNGTFEQLEPLSFPDFHANQPENSPPITIGTGNYVVNDLGNRYTILF